MKFYIYLHLCQIIIVIQSLSYLIHYSSATSPKKPIAKPYTGAPKPNRRLAPCQACRTLVNSFQMGLKQTAKGQHEGADITWDDVNKKVHGSSELHFVEIHESLCSELSEGKQQCHEMVTASESHLEEWWNTKRTGEEDLNSWLCINKLKVCCPDHHYGSKCLPCLGYPEDVCSGHGRCKGHGTRKGNGECSCDTGYSGNLCNSCAHNYYEAYRDTKKLLCSACHKACHGGCSGAGSLKCAACKEGWETDDEKGCIDLNECLLEREPCKINEFCVNAEGSYKCIECDRSCDGCFGDGPDMCEKCGSGFFLQDKICIDGSTAGRNFQISTTRYLTYFGLCIATCIIFQKNIAIASMIGLAVAVYITASEYLLNKSQF